MLRRIIDAFIIVLMVFILGIVIGLVIFVALWYSIIEGVEGYDRSNR